MAADGLRLAAPTFLVRLLGNPHYGFSVTSSASSCAAGYLGWVSGHDQYWLWGPGDYDGAVPIDMGSDLIEDQTPCSTARMLGHCHAAYIMPYEDGSAIIRCLGLRAPIGRLWPRLKHFD